ncbi:MAG: ACT domain-containing protein [Oscillospiraceae bacterium]|nr:ACT domain-containing protein [Oscillospiraceae bacterium]
MSNTHRQYIVDASVLPEVFIKVCEAKRLLSTGEADTIAKAVETVGISRSAFYKYKDFVSPLRNMKRDETMTLSILTMDRPGTLVSVLSVFAAVDANIITINQSIPTNGAAIITISFICGGMEVSPVEISEKLRMIESVLRVEILAN